MAFQTAHGRSLFMALVIAALFFFMSSMFLFATPKKFTSPDETANYLLAAHVAQGKGLTIASDLTTSGGIVAPRSFLLSDGKLLPAGFLGLPILFGSISRIVGTWAVPFLTPLFSSAALLCFFLLLTMIVRKEVALLSTALLAIHPTFWYYSVHGMFHNALFLDLAIIGIYLLLKAIWNINEISSYARSIAWYALSGLAIGTAVAVRTSEIVWLAIVVLTFLIALRKRLDMRIGFWAFLVCAAIPMIIVFMVNARLFGQAFSFGYSGGGIETTSVTALTAGFLSKIGNLFFPFGIHFKMIAVNVWNYGLKIFWIPALVSLLGLFQAFTVKRSSAERLYTALFLFVSVWLIAYYGSWVIQDNPNPNTVSIGTSYTRYWLPVYALAIPFAASYILRFVDSIGRWRHLALIGMIALMTLSSVMIAVLDTNEGLAANRTAAIEYKHLADRAVSLTPSRAVIITGHADKIFFPERNVIVSVDAPSQLFKLRTLITKVPVYLYISSSVESPTAAKKAWSRRGIQLTDEQQLAEHEYLYRLLDSTYQTF